MIILFVIIGLSLLILVHELGHFLTAKIFGVKVEEFGLGFPPRLFGKKRGETTYSVNSLPFGGFVKIYGEDDGDLNIKKDPRSFVSQPTWKKSVIVLAGVIMNIIFGWLIFSAVFMVGSPEHLAVADVALDSPAEKAGFTSGDIIVEASFGGKTLNDPIKSDELISLVKSAGEEETSLKIKRGGETLEINVAGRLNPPPGQGSLGVSLIEIGFKSEPFFKSFIKSAEATADTLGAITVGFFNFFGRLFFEPKIIETITGPVGIFALAAESGALGFVYLLQLIALISLNLAVLNLIPFPALDGGRFFFLLIEKLKGSPLSRRFQMIVNGLGFAFLIVLMVVVTIQDIGKLIK